MKSAREEIRTLEVVALLASGEGLGRSLQEGGAGAPVRLSGVLRGERVEARVEKGARPRGRVLSLIEAHPERVTPSCPVAERCGGCDWMHASLALQHRMHLEVVGDLLSRKGLAPPLELVAVGEPFGYRDRARLHLQASGAHVAVGYRASRSRKIVAVSACPVLHPALERVFGDLRAALVGSRGEGEAQVARGAGGRAVVELRFQGILASRVFGAFGKLTESDWAGARLWPEGASAPASYGDPRPVIEAADGAALELAPGGFGQPSRAAAQALGRFVGALVEEGARVVELFAGSGTLSVMAAAKAASYLAVEQDGAALSALRNNLALRGLEARCVEGDANAYRLGKADLVLLDPPRAGATGAMARILEARPRRVIYVSCNPVSLASDLALLSERYTIDGVTLFDTFPQTSHVEAVASLTRAR